MNLQVSGDEILSTLRSVRDTTTNPEVRRVMARALEVYGRQVAQPQAIDHGLASAATSFLTEMAKVKRAERIILWLGPVVALVAAALLFGALRGFWLGL